VFTPHDRLTPAPVRQERTCMCAHGGACSSFAPGHAVHLIQARLVSATPAEWIDAIVASTSEDGSLELASLADGARIALWNGAGVTEIITAGEPVAYHQRYHALSAGGRLFNAVEIG